MIRTRDGKLLAYSQKCTHLSCAVVPELDEGILRCPCHEGIFDLSTGRNIAGPPPRPLPRDRSSTSSATTSTRSASRSGRCDVKPQRQLTRMQRTTVVYGMLCFVLILVVLQLWLLTATMNAYLGGDDAVVWPALAPAPAASR